MRAATAQDRQRAAQAEGAFPRIYYVQPLPAGPLEGWDPLLEHAAGMGFTHLLCAPPFEDGATGFPALDAPLDPALCSRGETLADLAAHCRRRGLVPMLDLPLELVMRGSPLARAHPDWFAPAASDELPDPRHPSHPRDVLALRWEVPAVADAAAEHLAAVLAAWRDAGIGGVRALAPQRLDAARWRRLTPLLPVMAWTPGLPAAQRDALAGAGFAHTFFSCCWLDRHAGGLLAEHAQLQRIAPPVAPVEVPFAPRIAASTADLVSAERASRRALRLAAATGCGLLLPMGFELGVREPLEAGRGAGDFARWRREPAFDLTRDVREANTWLEGLRGEGALLALSGADAPCIALLREQPREALLILANRDLGRPAPIPFDEILPRADGWLPPDAANEPPLEPGEVRLLHARRGAPVRAPSVAVTEAARAPRIAIEAVSPAVDGGRFAAKRSVGERVRVEADLFADGHEHLAAVLRWKAADEKDWRETPMRALPNDRWTGDFVPERAGLHLFRIECWIDTWRNFTHALRRKQEAAQDVTLELREGAALAADVLGERAASVELLLSDELAAAMASRDARPFLAGTQDFPVFAERRAASFGSWYELFPRSMSGDGERHGTFDDVIAQLPRIRDLGFDVLYFPPIHPIGRRNRKGRNNSLAAQPGEPGSPYAIGGAEGGHDAIHPELGTLDDFRRLLASAKQHGLEVALDFAIQCSPDHPWLKQHPDWFAWRPDGSLRYAENPPKKYEDIVNVDFYAAGAVPSLWLALRDVVLFWVQQGVKLFRVDNPHTKPLPFWEWMIAEVRGRDPDVIFLSEAFTRPKPMQRLAKAGFSQSYSYFTWRHTKREFIDYLTELTQTGAREHFRPHFFVNTPDINPHFLQGGGRAGFLMRAALATTLSGLWGMYSGFELCESRALPGKEEYLDSEKYQLRAWEWNRPGNINAEIAQLNRIRRAQPALQSHLGVQFHNAWNDQVLWFEKATPSRDNVLLVAIGLDPFNAQAADVELPLWNWGLPDDAALAAEDLLSGARFVWRGKRQRIQLPAERPYALWRVRPEQT
ncbi:MAG TPA: maltotransferase domain-containing protein [Candidatus Binatia bacterium]|nr:maltotransferase domain-containing protein [Candidatus Binatia bacterium]